MKTVFTYDFYEISNLSDLRLNAETTKEMLNLVQSIQKTLVSNFILAEI